jgi:hypothetical protein
MPSEKVINLVNIATNLLRKKLALRASAPTVFETLQNIDDQFREACGLVVASGEDEEFTEQQQYLINSAITGVPRVRLIELEKSYTSDDSDIVGELRDIKEVNFNKIVGAEREKFKVQEDYSKGLEKALRKEKVKNKFTKFLSGGMLAAMGFLLITK